MDRFYKIPPERRSQFLLNLEKKKRIKETVVNKDEILLVYSDFQKFMNWDNAPKIEIDIYTQNNNNFAKVTCPTKEDPNYYLHIHNRTKESRQNDYCALLFHEFTHIYDCVNLKPILIKNNAKKVFSWYSEAHAVVVSLMCLCEFNNIEEKRKVPTTDLIGYRQRMISIKDYFAKVLNEIKYRINNNQEILKSIQYYLGCLRFYSEYCIFSASELIQLYEAEYFKEVFACDIITKMAGTIAKNDLSTEAIINMKACSRHLIDIVINNNKPK